MNREDYMYRYMRRCLDLANLGLGSAAPNPMVGSVIVLDGKIIGEGYHHKSGEAHAEVNAINSVENKELLKQSTLYVNLEPCSHFGKTPPCADLIIKHQIPKVVIANVDPFSKVSGRGIERLKNAGIEVITGVLENEGKILNRRFFTFCELKRPYIILKWAQSDDGFIDIQRKPGTLSGPNWITSKEARLLVHKWRAEEAAIMVGTNTAEIDNPQLNVRDWAGKSPIRVLVDRTNRLSHNLHLFDGQIPTLVFTEKTNLQNTANLEFINLKFDDSLLTKVMDELYSRQLQSIIIEGGNALLNSIIKQKMWDEARVFTGNKKFETGVPAPKLDGCLNDSSIWNTHKLNIYKIK